MNLPTVQPELPAYHVIVQFGPGFMAETQGQTLLILERWLREQDIPAEVFKATMPDDSKLRRSMTPEQRSKL